MINYRAEISGLTDAEAAAYLLSELEATADSEAQAVLDVMDAARRQGGNIPRGPAILFVRLWRAKGRSVAHPDIFAAMERVAGEASYDRRVLSTHAKRLRRAIEALGWPVQVQSVYGLGYRLEVTRAGWEPGV